MPGASAPGYPLCTLSLEGRRLAFGEGREDLLPVADENTSLIYANEIKDQILCPNLQTILTIGLTI